MFDVTGAGQLELGDINSFLRPFRRHFREVSDTLELEVIVDREGAILHCRNESSHRLEAAGIALCQHAMGSGRFVPFPQILLDFTQATYRISVGSSGNNSAGRAELIQTRVGYPLEGSAIRFGTFMIPPLDQRLTLSDVNAKPMRYPIGALRRAIEARVTVAITFGEDGRVVSCRPIYSSNTSRMAYDTCLEARKAFTLLRTPDPRPFVWSTVWLIGE
ncbi:hypothetical protein [Qipengyuania sp. ASV99]|uniref:hypothetical protein n=1 Tax=Qipengyuania sp. ASV99 TaxID=3399681 RepID=UPI003A4C68C6